MISDEQREELGGCETCMTALCDVCGHEPCPVCVDDCDHPDCIEWNEQTGSGTKKHVCIFKRCEKHAETITFELQPLGDQEKPFLDALVASGMRETNCRACGCKLFTRGDDDRCPPCRDAAKGGT